MIPILYMKSLKIIKFITGMVIFFTILVGCDGKKIGTNVDEINALKEGFMNPPSSAKPGVYWYFMDGNISKQGITADLESMKQAGIGSLIFLEVNVGIPRGKVDFFNPEWQDLFKFAESECRRLDIRVTLGVGPGWTGSGGPWVTPNQSMQQLVLIRQSARIY